jgi:uracil-DNA glycosylase
MGGAVAGPPLEGRRVGRGAPRPELLSGTLLPVPTDDISQRYLEKAIAEINDLSREIAQEAGEDRASVVGSGHPQADLFLLKYGPQTAEQHEGVAFFGRAGQAVLKSLQRLHVDPTAIYGTNCLKFAEADEEQAREWLAREIHIVQPKLIVVMGQDALTCLNAVRFPLAVEITSQQGSIQKFTPTIEAVVTPDLDASLDEAPAKKGFWEAFKAIGPWWSEQPPY